jgi:hypothetical protein
MTKAFDLRKVTTAVLLHLLRDEVRFPKLFLWRCFVTRGKLKERFDSRFPKELVELGTLPLWVYVNLKAKIGQKKAFEVMKVAILTGGTAMQSILFETIKRERNFENFSKLELEINKNGTTKWNKMEVIEKTQNRFELKVTRCLYHEFAKAAGVPEFTPIICQIDNAVFNSYLPDEMIFQRGGRKNRIADGSDHCRFIWELAN